MAIRRNYAVLVSALSMIGVLLAGGCSTVRYFVEKPKYAVLQDEGRLETRRYEAAIIAEVDAAGARYEAAERAFNPLADYIFGANIRGDKIAMTSPVTQRSKERDGQKIAMTSPVTQQSSAGGQWTVQFTMPSKYALADLPQPKNPDVRLREVGPKTFAAIRFRGRAKDDQAARKLEILRAYMRGRNLEPIGEPIYAYYDPPLTLPLLRRNEILIEVKSDSVR